jgi:hypothetical protein
MRRAAATLALLLLAGVMGPAPRAIAHTSPTPTEPLPPHAHEFPLRSGSSLALRGGDEPAMRFHGRWRGAPQAVDPMTTGGTLRVAGARDEGDSGTIRLPAERWSRKGKTFRYADPGGSAGGILSLQVAMGAKGGSLKMKAGTGAWQYRLDAAQTEVAVTLEIGTSRWCAVFGTSDLRQKSDRRLRGRATVKPGGCACDALVASTWAGVQSIFEQHGCTAEACHGSAPGEGGLDLRPDVAFANLVGVPSTADEEIPRVLPGDKDGSLLWQKLAVRTLGLEDVPGSGMPVGEVAPLSEDELRIISLWIYNGAPATGIVPDSDALLLSSCTPPPEPQKIPAPDPPAPGEGVQLHSAPWSVPVSSEDEVCFPTYYDLSGVIDEEFRGPCPESRGGPSRECFFYNRLELIQDPNSHHSIPRVYVGDYPPTHPSFGAWTCHGGDMDGTPCNPTNLGVAAPLGADCGGAPAECAGTPEPTIACIGYGPPDFGQGFNLAESAGAPSILTATEPRYVLDLPYAVMDAIPVSGVIVWNSHAFNATAKPTTNEQWLRFFFAPEDEQIHQLQDFFHIRDIFIHEVPPFERRNYCTTLTFRPGTRLFEMVSHTHKRGALFELWGPGISSVCSTAVDPACAPEPGPPALRTTDYADPDQVFFDPPMPLDGDDLSRSVKYCATYDNGMTDPTRVKRRSTAPPGAVVCTEAEIACLDGPRRGQLCGGDDAQCDSAPGAGDGVCDACPLRGWVTADDEMFALLGSYHCEAGVDCVLPTEFPRQFPGGVIAP